MSFLSLCRASQVPSNPFSFLGLGSVRTSTKRAGGSVSNNGGSGGKRLGIKKFSEQYVIPGNIIVRQRGTQFHPGQHVKMGLDHTLYAVAPGYVRFYVEKRPRARRKERRVVGIVLNKEERLPRDTLADGRSRYFGFVNLKEQGTLSNQASA